ncbi:MAG: AAA family ATPase [Deltaproteobacteria bacterium]|nr:AAA family ATPase [Deltaproteobacteria bacterium]
MLNKQRLNSEAMTWRCDPSQFNFKTTAEIPPLEETVGQDRALEAIDFGLGIKNNGFNLFILGQPGSGRSSTIKKILADRSMDKPVPDDWCYVYGFEDAVGPQYIRLPAGKGHELKKDVDRLVERLSEDVPKSFESKEFAEQKKKIAVIHQDKKKKLFQQLEQEALEKSFALQQVASGFILVPLKNKQPLSPQDYDKLSSQEKTWFETKGNELQERIDEVLSQVRQLEEELREKTLEMGKDVLLYTIGHLFAELEKKYQEFIQVLRHFNQCKKDIINQIEELRTQKAPQLSIAGLGSGPQEPSFDRYRINLLIDNTQLRGAPVIYEANPTYFNVFGRIEHIIQMGSATTNFQMIKPGALHRANGGYLILDCREVLFNLFTYEALKRCLRNHEIKLEDMSEQYRLIATASLKPQPIPLNCKIILIGTPILYYLLFQLDPDFRKYFKVKVDFDQMMKNTRENIQLYALFIGTKCTEENLVHFDPAAVARTVEYSARLIEDQRHFSSSFSDITDLIREAAYYAEHEADDKVTSHHVERALESRIYRSNKLEERIREMITDNTIFIDTEGSVVGQVNGLSVYQLGDYSFGMPARVTVRTFLGKGGMINIEREAKLSGPIHDKGILILSGFFGERYARDKQLALSASICFEQSYSGVEGDSASSTELYGLLSSLSGLPIKQEIAVTGSVNQHGQIQAIGGVNQKIEGFYAVCKIKGLTGNQGVIIPEANRKNLMLKAETIAAVERGEFHVWSIETIDQGIEILTGTSSGERQEDGSWPVGTVNDLVNKQLIKMARISEKSIMTTKKRKIRRRS